MMNKNRIRILFFIEALSYKGFIGGAEKVLITLANNMDQNKFDITVQTIYPDENSKLLNSNIKYKYCYSKKNNIIDLIKRFEEASELFYKKHIKDDYDIEVAFLEYESTKIISTSTNKKAQKIAWVHCDFNVAVRKKETFINKTKKQYNKFDKVICVSEQVKQSFDELFNNEFVSVVLHNVIDDNEIKTKSKESLPKIVNKDKFAICTVANFTKAKNIGRLLKACYRLHSENINFNLWLVGDGNLRKELEAFIDEHKMNEYVTLWGFQSNPYPFIANSDLLACSSIYEGFSTFITEGLVLGKPIVTTDVSGMKELLGNSEYGLITDNDDEDFYKGLKRMIIKPILLKEYSKQSFKRGQDFIMQKLVNDIEEMLVSMTKDKETC